MALLKTQKNRLLRAVVEAGFTPTDFRWDMARPDRLNYEGPGPDGEEWFFEFDLKHDAAAWAPGVITPLQKSKGVLLYQEGQFKIWLDNIKREAEAPDLWAEAHALGAKLAKLEEPSDAGANEVPLAGAERERLFDAVESVRRLVEARGEVDAQQREQMQKTLDEVKAAGATVSRKWLTQTILGAVIGVVIKGALTQENALWLLSRLADAFNAAHLFGEAAVRALGP